MRESVEITLLRRELGGSPDEYGQAAYKTTRKKIYAQKTMIRQSEFYEAAAVGLKPEIRFEVWGFEYGGEKEIEYRGEIYQVIRVADLGKSEKLAISCSREAGENVSP